MRPRAAVPSNLSAFDDAPTDVCVERMVRSIIDKTDRVSVRSATTVWFDGPHRTQRKQPEGGGGICARRRVGAVCAGVGAGQGMPHSPYPGR